MSTEEEKESPTADKQPEVTAEPDSELSEVEEDANSNDKSIDDDTLSKSSRELKSILAMSKEAKLDTNIAYKRKKRNSLMNMSKDKREAEQNSDDDSIMDDSSVDEGTKKVRIMLTPEIKPFKEGKDMFCWRCHRDGVNICCETCPRSFHVKCLKQVISDVTHWACPECAAILKAENTHTRSAALKSLSLEQLCVLLKFALNRMIQCQNSEPFLHPVSEKEFPEYKKYIIEPMDLTKMQKNIKNNFYGSPQAFEADAKWLHHNSVIFNSFSVHSKLTTTAKHILKVCRQELAEIENCANCYLNANTKKDTWFVEVCPNPHIPVWAKLRGFPYWPAKVLSTNSSGMVDVRFFGAHDRAWVHHSDCYLFSKKDPNTFKHKRHDIEKCLEELEIYIENLKNIYGEFRYAPSKVIFDPNDEKLQLQMLLPGYKSDEINMNNTENNGKDEVSEEAPVNNEEKIVPMDCDLENDTKVEKPESANEDSVKMNDDNVNDKEAQQTEAILDKISPEVSIKDIIKTPTLVDTNNILNATEKEENGKLEVKTTSPSKLKIADKLIKRLSGSDQEEVQSSSSRNHTEVIIENVKDKEMDIEKPLAMNEKECEQDKDPLECVTEQPTIENVTVADKDVSNSEIIENFQKVEEINSLVDLKNLKKKLFNIIHSSLEPNEEINEKTPEQDTRENKQSIDDTQDSQQDKINENEKEESEKSEDNNKPSKKRKLSRSSDTNPKIIKLTCEEELSEMKIKSEPTSDEETDNNLEAKKRYLSALNISEKNASDFRPKENEIRTRAKAEEKRERFKVVDNLTKVIDEVALNYDKKAANKDIVSLKAMPKIKLTHPRARKSFPSPICSPATKSITINKPVNITKDVTSVTNKNAQTSSKIVSSAAATINSLNSNEVTILPKSTVDTPATTIQQFFLISSPTISYATPPTMVPLQTNAATTYSNKSKQVNPPDTQESQNYIPLKQTPINVIAPVTVSGVTNPTNNTENSPNTEQEEDVVTLNNLLPDNLSKAMAEVLLMKPLPKLLPRPPGILSNNFDRGIPSSAGEVTAKINSMADRMADYFRGMLIETLEELGKSSNPEAEITRLKLENETLKHQHSVELKEIRRNVCTTIKELQASVEMEREKAIQETRAYCQAETIKKVEMAKSKQWCAMCSKEAQFYCCWNTSYCDYPCQQKHWPQHMGKCTQIVEKSTNVSNAVRTANQPLILRPTTAPKPGVSTRLIAKPTMVYLSKKTVIPQKQFKTLTTSGNHIVLSNGQMATTTAVSKSNAVLAATSSPSLSERGNF